MGDWLHVHHCVICREHATALHAYEALELAGEGMDNGRAEGPEGLRWGFWNLRVLLVTTTSKWGTDATFVRSLIADLPGVECFTLAGAEHGGGLDEESFYTAVKDRLGAERWFLWSHEEPVMRALLEDQPPLQTALTTLALRPLEEAPGAAALSPSVVALLSGNDGFAVTHGFMSHDGECFVVGRQAHRGAHVSPLSTPLAACRCVGSGGWAITNPLDGARLLPVHAKDSGALWRMERHGPHGMWQPLEQRVAHVRAALVSSADEERQAGCMMARHWRLGELIDPIAALADAPSELVRSAAANALAALQPARPSVRPPGASGEPCEPEELVARMEAADADEALDLLGRLSSCPLSDDLALRVAVCVEELVEFMDADRLLAALPVLARVDRRLAARVLARSTHRTPDQVLEFRDLLVEQLEEWIDSGQLYEASELIDREGERLRDGTTLVDQLLGALDRKHDDHLVDMLGVLGRGNARVWQRLRSLSGTTVGWRKWRVTQARMRSADPLAWTELEGAVQRAVERRGDDDSQLWLEVLALDQAVLSSERGAALAEQAVVDPRFRAELISVLNGAPASTASPSLLRALTRAEVTSPAPEVSRELRKGIAELMTRSRHREHLRAIAESHPVAGQRVLAWVGLARCAEREDVERARELMDHEVLGAPARWVVASRADVTPELAAELVGAGVELGELGALFLRCFDRSGDLDLLVSFSRRVTELARAATRTSYWMVRYGAPGRDALPPGEELAPPYPWSGALEDKAGRIGFWAARAVEAGRGPEPRRACLSAYIAFDELLASCRANRVFSLPPIGVIHGQLAAILDRADLAIDLRPFGNAELAELDASYRRLGVLYKEMKVTTERRSEFRSLCIAALEKVPRPLEIWCYSQYGRAALPMIAWIANVLAWELFEEKDLERALPYARVAMLCADFDNDEIRDTLVRILLGLGRSEEAHRVARCVLARDPENEYFNDPPPLLG